MNHARKTNQSTVSRDHEPDPNSTSILPSKSSQPPIAMSSQSKMDTGWKSPDTRIYYAKKYRQVLSSAPASALAVIAGVSGLRMTFSRRKLTISGPFRKRQSPHAIVCRPGRKTQQGADKNIGVTFQMRGRRPNTPIALKVFVGSGPVSNKWKTEVTQYSYNSSGTLPPLVSITFSRALGFSIYRKAKYTFDSWIEKATGTSPLQHVNKPGTYPTIYTLACFTGAGMVSGGVTAVVLSRLLPVSFCSCCTL